MCGRFYLADHDLAQDMRRIIEEINRKKTPEGMKTSGEICPTDIVPVLANSRKGDVQPFAMRWGYSFPGGRPVINAKSETASAKPMFRDGMKQRRCLIPASSYFEWEKRGGKRTKYSIRPEGRDMLYLAGIYHLEQHGSITVPTFVILTREAASGIRFIHERMPVIFEDTCADMWLDSRNAADAVAAMAMTDMEYAPA